MGQQLEEVLRVLDDCFEHGLADKTCVGQGGTPVTGTRVYLLPMSG